jgi:hypothetical protein
MSWAVPVILPLWALGLVWVYSMCRIPDPPAPGSRRRKLLVKSDRVLQAFRCSDDAKTLATHSSATR